MTEQGINQPGVPSSSEILYEIDLLDLLKYMIKRIWIMLLGLVGAAAIAGLYTQTMITPTYRAYSIIYVLSKSTSITSLSDLQLSTNLTDDFLVLATTRNVLEQVIDELQLSVSYEQLVGSISVVNPSDTRYLYIYVSDADPQRAVDISNKTAEVLSDRIAEIMLTDRPSMVQDAVLPYGPSSPNIVRNMMLSGLLGFVVLCLVFSVRYLMDDTFKTPEDITRYLGVGTLATISKQRDMTKSKKKSSQSHASRKKATP